MTAPVEEWKRRYETARLAHEEARADNERLLAECRIHQERIIEIVAENTRLRAVVTRAKDALLDGQSTQWVHDLLVSALLERKP